MSLPRCVVRAALALSVIFAAIPAAAAPGAFQLTGTAMCVSNAPAIFLQWTTSSGATSYEVMRDDGQHSTVVATGYPGTAYDTNVVAGGPAHTYFVRASDGGPVTVDSNSVTVAPPATLCSPPPVPFTITGLAFCDPGDPQRSMKPAVQVDWHAVFYATSYDVYRDGVYLTTFNSSGASRFTLELIGDILGGQTMTFYVVAKNAAGTSTSNTVELTVAADICSAAPPVPVLSGSAGCDYSHVPAVQLDWTIVTGASGFQVFRNGAPYALLDSLGYSDRNVVPGQTYTYNVATTGLSAPLSNTVTVAVPEGVCTPGPLVVTPRLLCNDNRTGVALTWTASMNATSYTVMRDSTTLISGITPIAPGYYDGSAVPGATYAYRVLGVNGSLSTASAPVTVTVSDEVCPPGLFTSSAAAICLHSAPAVRLTWSASVHATSYVISRDGTAVLGTLSSTAREYADDTASRGDHYYSVKALNAAGDQTSNTNISLSGAACGLAPGTFTASVIGFCNQGTPAVRVTWSPVDGAASYVVVRNGITLPGSASGSYDDTSVVAGQSYTYAVIASNANGNATASAGPIIPTLGYCPPSAFTLMAATGCNPPVTLAWTVAANNVLSYSIFREQQLIAFAGSNMLTYSDYSAQANALYTYFVRANGTGGVSDSNVVTAHVDQTCEGTVPDLTALDIKPSALSGRVGDTIALSVELANLGNGTAMAATARVRFGRGPTMSSADLVLGTIPLPAMGSVDVITRTMNVKLPPVAAGTYYLFLSLDEEHVSGEVHFGDDVKASSAFSLTDMIPPKRRAATH